VEAAWYLETLFSYHITAWRYNLKMEATGLSKTVIFFLLPSSEGVALKMETA
jgi:hypothetical protein